MLATLSDFGCLRVKKVANWILRVAHRDKQLCIEKTMYEI